ncbi:MAG: hypothetical protein GC172_13590 [Phycisphaera sp.]|nr:hypothetical protein [Phycisphaera sp.]
MLSLSLSLSLSLFMTSAAIASTPPLSPPSDWKPIEPPIDGWNDFDCAIFWQWREVPASGPHDPVFCTAPDWGLQDPSNAFPPVSVLQPEVCTRIGGPWWFNIELPIAYYWAQCDKFSRSPAGWTSVESASRLTQRSGRCDSCQEIVIPDGNSVNAQDRLVIRFLPLLDAKPIRVGLRAKTKIRLVGRLEVGNCDAAFAQAYLHAKTDFKPGIWSAEIAAEMELENQGTLAATVDQTLRNPGHVLTTATGISIGGSGTGGSFNIGFNKSTQTPPSRYAVSLDHPRSMEFYAAWCIAPPPSGNVAEFTASVDLETDTHVTQDQAHETRAKAIAETLVLKFTREPLSPEEEPCSECMGGQPAVGPQDFPGGGGGQ